MIGGSLLHDRIESQLGQGGMGVVYRALDTKLNRPGAIKVLPRDRSGGSDVQEALRANLAHQVCRQGQNRVQSRREHRQIWLKEISQ
jgi:serine/threonine protein kinase